MSPEAPIAEGQPSVLTRGADKAAILATRREALRGLGKAGPKMSWDEYPFASTVEGGAGARVSAVPVVEQNIQGGVLSSFYDQYRITAGRQFGVRVIP